MQVPPRSDTQPAVPNWADSAAVKVIYTQAAAATAMFEAPCHVDHIVPLKNSQVCGLHWEGNLRVTLGAVNLSKHNRFDPDQDFLPPDIPRYRSA